MYAQIDLSHYEDLHILATIADQNLTAKEILDDLEKVDGIHDSRYMLDFNSHLNRLVQRGVLVKTRSFITQYYAIAPKILSLNSPPYSYQSWRILSKVLT